MTRPPSTPPTHPQAVGHGVCWHLVIPVKDGSSSKSRLSPAPPLARRDLALALALDTIESACSALSADQVTVVTSDPGAAACAQGLGARVLTDPGAGLNAAVAAGWESTARTVLARGADASMLRTGWAALLGDLPSMRGEDLRTALASCSTHREAVVPDADGTGTVLLTSTAAPPLPQFGPGSAARHASTSTVLLLDLPRLRTDVDTVHDLRMAVALGVGRHTRAALARGGGS
ncbi:MAG: 2-phospho-L-lactate guanylyltransferase [Ornithinimicrobium sp.]|uniref:2-phospho-L-lactate guanylyltransferase n=1 Tax=Ornithinimicrobium sp. TaxID=1977084 RepID=UPI0026DFF698|nr:2-phospho-L-lactate guanylyltransferase [Ornithinimicrobium sp.]MDO5740320.1 2-phospho-L-lactate guanylyltransferase [Ornithinimicrobium sp.]